MYISLSRCLLLSGSTFAEPECVIAGPRVVVVVACRFGHLSSFSGLGTERINYPDLSLRIERESCIILPDRFVVGIEKTLTDDFNIPDGRVSTFIDLEK